MTTEILRRGLRAGRRRRGHEHPVGVDRRPTEAGAVERDLEATQAIADPPRVADPPPETEWSAHRMASVLCMLAAFASEEPVHSLDQGQALQDMFAARLLDNPPGGPWTVNEAGLELLARYGLDAPIPIEVRRLERTVEDRAPEDAAGIAELATA